jgi:hypothetical protein
MSCVIKKKPTEYTYTVTLKLTRAEIDTVTFALGFLGNPVAKNIARYIKDAWQNLGM